MTNGAIEVYGGDYEHTLSVSGTWNGIGLKYIAQPMLEILDAMLNKQAYEICEFSLSNYLMLRDRGAAWIHALPIFPYRAFRHSTLHVHRDSTLTVPEQLRGKRVGVPDFSMTAAVWTRGILRDAYNVAWEDIHWVSGRKSRFALSPEVVIERIDGDLEQELIAGRIDALLTTRLHDKSKPSNDRALRCLIPDVQQVERDYLKATCIYPINHAVCVRSDRLSSTPKIAAAVFAAYEASKQQAYRRCLGTSLIPWGAEHWSATMGDFGADPMSYGLTPQNRVVVQTFVDYLKDQKLIATSPQIDSLFVQ
jgi:4,5-dihydroxyphthalate decarboxylase